VGRSKARLMMEQVKFRVPTFVLENRKNEGRMCGTKKREHLSDACGIASESLSLLF
jgi:hypothetical protein